MTNQAYLKDWDDFADASTSKGPILLPIAVDINEHGELTRERIRAGAIKELYIARKDQDFPAYLTEHPEKFPNPHLIFRDYVEYFAAIDGAQGPGVASPLDLKIKRPVWMLFHLPRKNWKFTVNKQYSVENDRDDLLRNYAKVCMMDDMNVLILSNACLSGPEGLKFNLHVTISQENEGHAYETDIIIDPGTENDGGIGDGSGTGRPPPPPPPPSGP